MVHSGKDYLILSFLFLTSYSALVINLQSLTSYSALVVLSRQARRCGPEHVRSARTDDNACGHIMDTPLLSSMHTDMEVGQT